MGGFVSRLDEINALADHSPGFVWRLQTPVGNATYFRPYPEDDRILINIFVSLGERSGPSSLCLQDRACGASAATGSMVREVLGRLHGAGVGASRASSWHG